MRGARAPARMLARRAILARLPGGTLLQDMSAMAVTAPDFRLDGRRILVTGASMGIGRAIARAAAASGAEVVLAARRRPGLEEVAAEIAAAGGQARVLPFDAADPGAIRQAMAMAGPLDGLVNNAGSVTREPFLEASEAEMDRVLALNVKGATIVAQEVARGMTRAGSRGSIVNIASIAGLVGARNRSLYAATKHAVMGLTRAMALELGPHGIRVNAVCPGLVNTPLAAELMADAAFVAATRARIPLGRILEPEDIAGPAVFLLSAAASGITGIALPVDGGVTAE